jgi:hypothetical protein
VDSVTVKKNRIVPLVANHHYVSLKSPKCKFKNSSITSHGYRNSKNNGNQTIKNFTKYFFTLKQSDSGITAAIESFKSDILIRTEKQHFKQKNSKTTKTDNQKHNSALSCVIIRESLPHKVNFDSTTNFSYSISSSNETIKSSNFENIFTSYEACLSKNFNSSYNNNSSFSSSFSSNSTSLTSRVNSKAKSNDNFKSFCNQCQLATKNNKNYDFKSYLSPKSSIIITIEIKTILTPLSLNVYFQRSSNIQQTSSCTMNTAVGARMLILVKGSVQHNHGKKGNCLSVKRDINTLKLAIEPSSEHYLLSKILTPKISFKFKLLVLIKKFFKSMKLKILKFLNFLSLNFFKIFKD